MNILVVAATSSEITSEFIKRFPVLITGVGMVNTAINLTQELLNKKYDYVVNMGIAGSFSDDLKIGQVVEVIEDNFSEIGYESASGFLNFREFNLKTKYLNSSQTSLKNVRAITVNTVHGNEHSINDIKSRMSPDIESMEGASIFQTCNKLNVKCLQLRCISNKVEIRDKKNWDIDLAISNLNLEVEQIIMNL